MSDEDDDEDDDYFEYVSDEDDEYDYEYTALIYRLRDNNDDDDASTTIEVPFRAFRVDRQVEAAARALRENELIKGFAFDFRRNPGEDNEEVILNWQPLLQEIATREKLESAQVWIYGVRNIFLSLFRDQFFQALQRNTNIRQLELFDAHFPDNDCTAGVVSFLEDAPPALVDLRFSDIETPSNSSSREALQSIAAAIARSSGIPSLQFDWCRSEFICPIFQSLAAPTSTSGLQKLAYRQRSYESMAVSAGLAMQQYLESPRATVRCLELNYVKFDSVSEGSSLLLGLSQNSSVNELAFSDCHIGVDRVPDGDDVENQEDAQLLANLLRDNSNVTILRFADCSFFRYPLVLDAIATNITRRESALRCLDITPAISIRAFRAVLTALSNSTRIESLIIHDIQVNHTEHLKALREELPLVKIKELTLEFSSNFDPLQFDSILKGIKHNYSIEKAFCERESVENDWPTHAQRSGENNFLTEAHKSRLEFFMDRNQKLAKWTENPKLVPQELWLYALNLALEAGINTLFQSLLALSGQGIGLKRGRKRNRPNNYKPV